MTSVGTGWRSAECCQTSGTWGVGFREDLREWGHALPTGPCLVYPREERRTKVRRQCCFSQWDSHSQASGGVEILWEGAAVTSSLGRLHRRAGDGPGGWAECGTLQGLGAHSTALQSAGGTGDTNRREVPSQHSRRGEEIAGVFIYLSRKGGQGWPSRTSISSWVRRSSAGRWGAGLPCRCHLLFKLRLS